MATLDLSEDELNLALASVGVAMAVVASAEDPRARDQLLALQRKLMAARGDSDAS